MKSFQLFLLNLKVAAGSIQSNLLRSILTMLIIAIGITALVGILTAIEAIKTSINANFSSMGANTFTIRNRALNVHMGRRSRRPQKFPIITWEQARDFKKRFKFPAQVGISFMADQTATLQYGANKTNPNIPVFGGDENYLACSGYEVERGRNFSAGEITSNAHVILLGSETANALFKNLNPVGKIVAVSGRKYLVTGVLKEKGNSMSFGGDKLCIVPAGNARLYYNDEETSFVINVLCFSNGTLEAGISEASGLFRQSRKLTVRQADNFEIIKSDSLANLLIENIQYVTLAATIIGFITLLGAAIGLMNIMLVSVTERIREIGIRKSLGATPAVIRNQFLSEAILICQMGGALGIVLGLLAGNGISGALGIGFVVPWKWIFSGVGLCMLVGLLAGIIPAGKAARLDPVEALRYE
jgi:putative ABC transport system permease protein